MEATQQPWKLIGGVEDGVRSMMRAVCSRSGIYVVLLLLAVLSDESKATTSVRLLLSRSRSGCLCATSMGQQPEMSHLGKTRHVPRDGLLLIYILQWIIVPGMKGFPGSMAVAFSGPAA